MSEERVDTAADSKLAELRREEQEAARLRDGIVLAPSNSLKSKIEALDSASRRKTIIRKALQEAGLVDSGSGRKVYSSNLPEHLLEAFYSAQSDPDLLSLRSDLAIVELRLGALVGKYEQSKNPTQGQEQKNDGASECKSGWVKLKAIFGQVQSKISKAERSVRSSTKASKILSEKNKDKDSGGTKDKETLSVPVSSLEDIQSSLKAADFFMQQIASIFDDYDHEQENWKEIVDLLSLRTKLSEAEQKRLMQMKLMVSGEEAIALTRKTLEILNQELKAMSGRLYILIPRDQHTYLREVLYDTVVGISSQIEKLMADKRQSQPARTPDPESERIADE